MMYPKSITDLAALIAAISPFVIWAVSALQGSRTRAAENDLVAWRRLNEITEVLHKGVTHGLWRQIAATGELGEARGKTRRTARAILIDAKRTFAPHEALTTAIDEAIKRIEKHRLGLLP